MRLSHLLTAEREGSVPDVDVAHAEEHVRAQDGSLLIAAVDDDLVPLLGAVEAVLLLELLVGEFVEGHEEVDEGDPLGARDRRQRLDLVLVADVQEIELGVGDGVDLVAELRVPDGLVPGLLIRHDRRKEEEKEDREEGRGGERAPNLP